MSGSVSRTHEMNLRFDTPVQTLATQLFGETRGKSQTSILASSGPKLKGFDDAIDGLTRQNSRSEMPQVGRALGGFEASIPSRPSLC